MAFSPKLLQMGASGAGSANYIEDVFSCFLHTGNGATQTITNGIDLSTKGGLTWFKKRNGATASALFDSDRGAQNYLSSSSTGAQSSAGVNVWVQNTTGFSLGNGGGAWNGDQDTFASWTFRKQPKFFDVVTYTGTGSNTTIAHSLGSVPGSIIVKRTDTTAAWAVYHRSLANTQYLVLNTTAAEATGATWWNSTTPTSAVFSVGTDASVNASGGTYVAYLFAHDAGGFGLTGTDNVISCGGFTTDGGGIIPTVNLGYEPQWIMFKSASSVDNWYIADNMRGWYNQSAEQFNGLRPNLSNAEVAGFSGPIITPTGFTGPNANFGASNTFIYIAIRRGPMKVPTVGTSVFTPATRSATGAVATVTGVGFPPDLYFSQPRQSNRNPVLTDRLRGATKSLSSRGTYAEQTETGSVTAFGQDGVTLGANNADFFNGVNDTGFTFANWNFRRAPRFFDIVCYTGTGSNTTFTHNLGVVPELMIVKRRDTTADWDSYCSALANTEYVVLNTTAAKATGATRWNSTTPTSSVFSVGTSTTTNASAGTYVAYLFATCPGVSKVGSYTGTATTLQVDCGFTAGARFVLIKRTDSTGDWYVWDSVRGIISGNDPYLLMNSTAAEVTNTDYIDPYSAGFELSSTAPDAINANGGTYIFLAIA